MMGPLEAVGSVLSRYFQFSGRASRAEFWWFMLFDIFMRIALVALDVWFIFYGPDPALSLLDLDPWSMFYTYYSLLVVIPFLAVSCRRLHDGGFSGFWLLLHPVVVLASGVQVAMGFTESFSLLLDGATQEASLNQTVVTIRVISGAVAGLGALTLFAMLCWPTDQDDNMFGAPRHRNWAGQRKQSNGAVRHDPLQAYAVLFENDRKQSPDEVAAREVARKAEVRSLYEQRVLGRS